MSLIVTGTGTEVGKTLVSALIAQRYGTRAAVAYWKPLATGACDGRDTDTVAALAAGRVVTLPECYVYDPPLSPHLAARQAGRPIDPLHLEQTFATHARAHRSIIVEGVGGALVPLCDDGYLLATFLQRLALPCVVVASSTLGTINHTLLTLEALRARGIAIAGVVLNGPENRENSRAIARFGEVRIIATVPPLTPLTAARVATQAQQFDVAGVLAPHLTSQE